MDIDTEKDQPKSKNDEQAQSLDQKNNKSTDQRFKRKFRNIDMTTCWLNSCLQLILNAMDHSGSKDSLTSELGEELMKLQRNRDFPLESRTVKNILVTTEDTRVATRISELAFEVDNPFELEHRTQNIQDLRLNLNHGQQCVRDFFLCLNENLVSWPDVYFSFAFKIIHSTKCCTCNQIKESETSQIYIELQVPPDGSNLNDQIEEYFNNSSLIGAFCEIGCKDLVQSEKRSTLTKAAEAEFFTVVLTRAVQTLDGFQINRNKIISTNDVFIRYIENTNLY